MQQLRVGEHGVGVGTEEVGVPDVEQPHPERHVGLRRCGAEVLVHRVEPGEQLGEALRPDRHDERQPDRGVHRVAPTDPVPEAERVVGVDPEVGHLVECRGHGDEVLGDRGRLVGAGRQVLEEPGPAQAGVGERLEGAEGLAGDDEQRRLRVEVGQRLPGVGGVDVADEAARQPVLAVGLERLVGHHGAEVGPADADVDDRLDPLARHAGPLARPHAVGEGVHPVEHLVDVGHDVLAVDAQRRVGRQPERRVEHRAVLGDVDVLARQHGVAPPGHVDLVGEREQRRLHVTVEEVLRQVHVEVGGRQGLPVDPLRRQRGAQVGLVRRRELAEPLPRRRGGGVDRLAHARAASRDFASVVCSSSQATTNLSTPSLMSTLITSS